MAGNTSWTRQPEAHGSERPIRTGARWLRWLDRPKGLFNRRTQLALDGVLAIAAAYLAYLFHFDGQIPADRRPLMWLMVGCLALLRPLAVGVTRAHRTIWRYFSLRDIPDLLVAVALPTGLLTALWIAGRLGGVATVPGTFVALEFTIFLLLAAALRGLRRLSFEAALEQARRRTLLVAPGETLAAAARHLAGSADVELLGLITPTAELQASQVAGFPVLGTPADTISRALDLRVDLIFVADARMSGFAGLVEAAGSCGIEVRVLPSAGAILRGEARVARNVQLSDVVAADNGDLAGNPATESMLQAASVLITGAGGSIGSELSRQVARSSARRIILLDQDENAIFCIEQELQAAGTRAELVPRVGNIQETALLRDVFSRSRPSIVLHAAAYKHVPVMEVNAPEAFLNNVVGTRELLNAATEFGSERFVMISTDKAVRPSSVMGATKRLAEALVQARAAKQNGSPSMLCACVRFGNVLGSRGSVAPIFLSQIAAGGPVTITHEEMTRYFMTIPEAVRLVLQAATLASHGEIFMLDMGDPVRITALARRLILLAGLQPGRDIEIRYTGMRPGEKLHEQLWSEDARVARTSLERVWVVNPAPVPPGFEESLIRIERAARIREHALVLRELQKLVGTLDPGAVHEPVHGPQAPERGAQDARPARTAALRWINTPPA